MRRTTITLRTALLATLACAAALTAAAQPAPADGPFTVDYYYTARWGYADEFLRLFKKNHYPLLKKQVETGRLLSVSAVRARYHGTEDGRWDYRVTLVFKNVAAAHDNSAEEGLIKQLFQPLPISFALLDKVFGHEISSRFIDFKEKHFSH